MPRRKPGLQPADDLLELPLPESAEAFVAQARAMRQRVAELEEKLGQAENKISDCKEDLLAVKQKYDLPGLMKRRKEITNDIRRLAYEHLRRAEQMTINFRKTA